MKRFLKNLLWIIAGLLVVAGAGLGVLLLFFSTPEVPAATLAAKYGQPPSKFLKLPGGTVAHFRDYPATTGDPAAPLLVLLHGSNASLHTWEPWAQRLRTTMRVISVDLPGHGLTGATVEGDYSVEGMVAFVESFTRTLGIERPFVVGGNSIGGHVAWRFALAHPDRVSKLILVDAAGVTMPGVDMTPPLGFRLARSPIAAPILRHFAPRALFEKTLEAAFYDKSLVTPEMVDRYWELNRRPGTPDATFARFRSPLFDPALMDQLHQISVPTLVLWGREDALIPVRLAGVYAEKMPNARVIIYDHCGHIPMEEVADQSAADVRAFVAAVPVASPKAAGR
ncbi:MAG TPA: alpha/beta fold hydrolase [Terriglobales bacterium]